MLVRIIFIIFCSVNFQLQARPVSYPSGLTFMQMNDVNVSSAHIHYSPTAKYSIGFKAEDWQEDDWQFYGIQLNNLLKRWNKKASQANIYLKTAIGVAYSDQVEFANEQEGAGFIALAADWEDRRFFASYENGYHYAGDIAKFFHQQARIGVAPYIGDYGDLHSWLMLQISHNPTLQDEELNITPLVRVFKDVYLFETGMSLDGDFLFNTIIRF